jgi:hypothetical protein
MSGSQSHTWNVSETSSGSSSSSDLTDETVPGIGSLSGKALLIVGNGVLRGINYAIARGRLKVIASKFSAMKGDPSGIENMYDDLLEFSW